MDKVHLALLQEASPQQPSAPLFLVHDGSGGIGSYARLGALDRDTWAFENLTVQKSGMWQGCIQELAQSYCEMILEVHSEGDIILGGWSMGGLITQEMARWFLETHSPINVIGVIMIESLYPGLLNKENVQITPEDLCLERGISMTDRKRAVKLIADATRVAKSYESISWLGDAIPPATTILVRADDPIPSRHGTPPPALLGWDQLSDDWITTTYSVPGHHFSIFQDDNVQHLTQVVAEACIILEISLYT